MSPTDKELFHHVVRMGHAANVMGMDRQELRQAAEKAGIDTTWGFQIQDLIRLCMSLSAMSYEPQRKAKLRDAMRKFVAQRDAEKDAA